MNTLRITLLATATLIAGCSGQPDSTYPADETTGTAPTGTETPAVTAPPAATLSAVAGTVEETMDSGGYTYALVNTGTEQVWVAGPEIALTVGEQVDTQGPMAMPGFRSETLGRTFDMVYFVGAILTANAPAEVEAPAGHGAPAPVAAEAADFTGLAKADGGQTVEEIFTGKDTLVGNEVVIRAKVVKYSGGIMGKNWMHLQDGTGGEGTNDLTITTDAVANVGDTVLVRGTLVADKDFGYGYEYALIIEDAAVTVE